jgi:hypothetical protein
VASNSQERNVVAAARDTANCRRANAILSYSSQ